ncbi:MAG: hypothetical protein WBA23_03105 [Tunicatimonas sp.]|uniref:hypothetical protein n=1 Tax=Tunicatimonas sp. TaxID=1940096 RepID=UPI003C729D6C
MRLIFLIGWLLLLGCQQDDAGVLTLEQQLTGEWQLDALQATIQVDGEDYKVFFAQLADSLGLAPEEIAIGLLLLESQVAQQVLERELTLNLQSGNLFKLHQIDSEPLLGGWQLSEDEQQLILVSEEEEILTFSIVSVNENEMILQIGEDSDFLLDIPQVTQQLDIRLEMNWITDKIEK